MSRNAHRMAATAFLCGLLSVSLFNPAKAFAQQEQSQVAPGLGASHENVTDPAWLRWISSEAGKRALHHSPHPAAPGLLMALGEEPTITVLSATADASSDETRSDTSAVVTVTPCPANGTQASREPFGGDPLAPFLGEVQPDNKIATGIDFAPGRGLNGGDFVVYAAWDQRGLFGGLGNSLSLVAVHDKDAVAGTPGCNANVEFGIPNFTDPSGVDVYGFSDSKVAYDATNDRFYFTDIHMGSGTSGAQNDAVIGVTTRAVIESAPCSGAAEGKAKNKACFLTIFSTFSSSYNVTMNTGLELLDVRSTQDASSFYLGFLGRNLSAGGTSLVDVEQCQFPVTGPGSCSPLGGGAFSSSPTNPINDFAMSPNTGSSGGFLFAYTQGTPGSQTVNVVKCTTSFPSAPSCGSPITIATVVSLANLRGEVFPISPHVSLASIGGVDMVVVDTCRNTPVTTPQRQNVCGASGLGVWTSTDGTTWTQFGMPTQAGSQFFSSLSTAPGNFNLVFQSTGNDKTNQSFTIDLAQIPITLTTPTITTLTPKPIDPSGDFSTGGFFWGPPQVSPNNNGVIYVQFDTTNAANGNWGNNLNQPKETNAILRATQ